MKSIAATHCLGGDGDRSLPFQRAPPLASFALLLLLPADDDLPPLRGFRAELPPPAAAFFEGVLCGVDGVEGPGAGSSLGGRNTSSPGSKEHSDWGMAFHVVVAYVLRRISMERSRGSWRRQRGTQSG